MITEKQKEKLRELTINTFCLNRISMARAFQLAYEHLELNAPELYEEAMRVYSTAERKPEISNETRQFITG